MKHRTRKLANRWLALVLCLCMVLPSAVTLVSAAEDVPGETACTGGICEHHPEHTADCGYVEAVEGQPCTHVHDENCGYVEGAEESICTHIHDESCGYVGAVEGRFVQNKAARQAHNLPCRFSFPFKTAAFPASCRSQALHIPRSRPENGTFSDNYFRE